LTGPNENAKDSGLRLISKASVTTKGRLPVETYRQDLSTRAIDIKVNVILDDTLTLATTPTVNSYDYNLTAGHGVIIGDNLGILEQNGVPQIYTGFVLNVVGNVVTMDTPVPIAFTPADASVLKINTSLNVDGSSVVVVANITNFFENAVDITRFIFHITDGTAMDDGTFGGIAALTRGIVLRKKLVSGNYINFWNIKTNGEFAELAYDVEYDPKAPAGVYGFRCRLTYAGEEKHGVVIRLEP
ncbi:unnamed protein product, partial [marine sediment metagenome]